MIMEDIEIRFLFNIGLMICFFFYFDKYVSYKLCIYFLYGNFIVDL